MKIYFAGSITGGREDVSIYQEIVSMLKKYGEVLSEHISFFEISVMGQTDITAEMVYKKDTDWIKEADVIIAEVTTPSLGVGYEVGLAEALGKKVICLHRNKEGRQVSKMILGNSYNICQEYKDAKDLESVFENLLK